MSGTGVKACVIGWPIKHSRSPLIHNYWLRHYGIAGSYGKVAVKPGDLGAFISALEDYGYAGCNITIPHKQAAMAHVDHVDVLARRIGAINTIWIDESRLYATNTDVHGFLANLDDRAPGWDKAPRIAAVLGAGGAARAIAAGLQDRGFSDIRMINRTQARILELAGALELEIDAYSWAEGDKALSGASLLVNTTSLGMAGEPPLKIELDPLRDGSTVCDIVYAPLETPLLRDAGRRGHRTVNGLGMLLHQAAPGFERWFKTRPAVSDELRRLVIQDLETGA